MAPSDSTLFRLILSVSLSLSLSVSLFLRLSLSLCLSLSLSQWHSRDEKLKVYASVTFIILQII